jgi:hypothetical protein
MGLWCTDCKPRVAAAVGPPMVTPKRSDAADRAVAAAPSSTCPQPLNFGPTSVPALPGTASPVSRSRAVALSASRAVITVSAMVILIGGSSTSMTLRQTLPGWDALSVHTQQQKLLPLVGRDLLAEMNVMVRTQLPVRCSTASGVASCAADKPVTTRLELSPRPWQGPRQADANDAERRTVGREAGDARGGTWHASSSPVPPAG